MMAQLDVLVKNQGGINENVRSACHERRAWNESELGLVSQKSPTVTS